MSPPASGGSGTEDPVGTARKAMLLRLDPAVHAALARWAADDLRSTNAHVEWLLRRALAEAGRLPSPATGRRGRPTRESGGSGESDGEGA